MQNCRREIHFRNGDSRYSSMSFVDLATLTMHRRHELENRIHLFDEKCDRAIGDIKKLKMKAKMFLSELNCEPSELKECFLSIMQKLEEYMYLITDFNLAIAQTTDDTGSTECTPVQDTVTILPPVSLSPYNLIDALSEPRPSTSCPCPNLCPPQKPVRARIPKEDQRLIVFSSSSSAESVQRKELMVVKDRSQMAKETQCQMAEEMSNLAIEEADSTPLPPPSPFAADSHECNPPAQQVLEVDHVYPAVIVHVDGSFFWIITEDMNQVTDFMRLMTEFYTSKREKVLTREEVCSLTYCAYYDAEDNGYYRAMFLKELKEDPPSVQLFVMDTGEMRVALMSNVRTLWPQFCTVPPFARCCHLAGIAEGSNSESEQMQKLETLLKEYIGTSCSIEVDDNSSESLGVYVLLPSNKYLNDIVVDCGLATPLEQPLRKSTNSPKVVIGPPADSVDEFDTECPEYEDPVVAVTGYHNRDEADICKHYKGGPDKTCFKGTRCTKKHLLKHPDGWTYDQVEVRGVSASVPLPAPGSWLKALVTCVAHFDRVYVQIHGDKEQEEIPEFGLVLPPTTLNSLQRDMSSPATVMAYKPLTMTPAPGEMVAAMYPMDGCWYRAKVLSANRADQSVEIIYVDYGTHMWVKENQIRELEARFASLPTQAVQCVLAGVVARGPDSQQWAQAKRALADMTMEQLMDLHVIAREFDELIVELYDSAQFSVAEQLASRGLVDLIDYQVTPDDDVTQKVVVPS